MHLYKNTTSLFFYAFLNILNNQKTQISIVASLLQHKDLLLWYTFKEHRDAKIDPELDEVGKTAPDSKENPKV